MHPVIAKTLGGLSRQYYFRQLFFALIIAAFYLVIALQSPRPLAVGPLLFIGLSTLLYPYARFVYESIVNFVLGDSVWLINAVLVLIVKLFTMLLCFVFAIFIAPLGLAYLYWHHSKSAA